MLQVNAGADVIDPHEICGDLVALEIWVAWRPQIKSGAGPYLHPDTGQPYKVSKVPVGPEGRPAAPRGLPLNEALKRARAHGGGLGIMLRAGDGLFCLDIDLHASSLTPDSEAIHQLVRRLGGWAHLSPSGHGIHIVGRAQLTEGHPRRLTLPELGAAELYSRDQFITITTVNYGPPEALPDVSAELRRLLDTAAVNAPEHQRPVDADPCAAAGECADAAHPAVPTPRTPARAQHPVARVGLHARTAQRVDLMRRRHPDVAALLDGRLDVSGGPPDSSETEFTLLGHLYYWLDGNAADMQAVMEASAFGQSWGRPEKWAGTRRGEPYLKYAIDRLRQKRAGAPTYRDQARDNLYRDRAVQAQLTARLAAAPGHGHSRVACERLLDELLAQACGERVRTLPGNRMELPISVGGLQARVGGAMPICFSGCSTFRPWASLPDCSGRAPAAGPPGVSFCTASVARWKPPCRPVRPRTCRVRSAPAPRVLPWPSRAWPAPCRFRPWLRWPGRC